MSSRVVSVKEIEEYLTKNPRSTLTGAMSVLHVAERRLIPYFKRIKEEREQKIEKPEEGIIEEGTDESRSITLVSKSIHTVDEALKETKVDLAIWEVERFVVNKWDVGAKVREQDLTWENGTMNGYAKRENKFIVQPLWQVKIWLRRKVKKPVQDAIEALMLRADKHSPVYCKYSDITRVKDAHLLEVSIFDVHLGKLAWSPETGTDYDLKIAQKLYFEAMEDLISKSKGFPINRILFPIGQDFFHLDNAKNMTVNDTPLDVDSRYYKIFETGVIACVKAIDYLMNIAPVDVVWVPGNHDRTTSYQLVRELKSWYRLTKRVNVDIEPKMRKYYRYGSNLIGFTHGNEERKDTLPSIMATECPNGWVSAITREWHIGHKHKSNLVEFEVDGAPVGIRVLPSISGTDSWHYRKGFANQLRAASAFLYSYNRGYTGYLLSLVRHQHD
jgi:hypothetical protein